MKTWKFILISLLLLHVFPATADTLTLRKADDYITVRGTVKDRSNKKAIPYASVSIAGQAIATVTNADGEFTFKIKLPAESNTIEFSHIGYHNTRVSLKGEETDLRTVWLSPTSKLLDEVVVSSIDARELVKEAISHIPSNYSTATDQLTGFYRETARKRRRYINIAEAVIDLRKTPYNRDAVQDRIQIVKGRRLLSPKASDTLAVKLLGGPTTAIYLDVVKNPDVLLSPEILPFYDFHLEETAFIDKRPQYVVGFQPNSKLPFALYHGKFYIDCENLSFTRAEFQLDMSDRRLATQTILHRKPHGLRFKPLEVTYQVNYKNHEGKTYLHYVRNEIHFKCDWKRKLFSTNYAVVSEMVVTDIKQSVSNIPARSAFGKGQVFSDKASLFYDKDFWGAYNIIQPEESLEKAVGKLRKE